MRSATGSYNAYPDTRYTDAFIRFALEADGATADAAPTASTEASISHTSEVCDSVKDLTIKIATLEGGWLLDGTYEISGDANFADEQVGWWGTRLSGADGTLSTPETLTLTFSQDFSAEGISILFDNMSNEYASDFEIVYYNSADAEIDTISATGNDDVIYVDSTAVVNFRKIIITFTKTANPYRYVRVAEVIFGIVEQFDRDGIVTFTLNNELSPASEYLPINEMSAIIDNSAHEYDMSNPSGIYAKMEQGAEVETRIGVGETRDTVEMIPTGSYYFKSAVSSNNALTAELIAQDAFYTLDGDLYTGGQLGSASVPYMTTVSTLVTSILAGTGYTSSIPAGVILRAVSGEVPLVSRREALRLVAQAAMCACYFEGTVVHFVDLSIGTSVQEFTTDLMIDAPQITVGDLVNKVYVNTYRAVLVYVGELYNDYVTCAGGTEIWIYHEPWTVSSSTVNMGTIDSETHYMYASKYIIDAMGIVNLVVTGSQREKRISGTQEYGTVAAGETEYPITIDNPLMTTAAIALDVAEWVYNVKNMRQTYEIQTRGDPCIELGDTIEITDSYGTVSAVVVKHNSNYDGTLSARITAIRGAT